MTYMQGYEDGINAVLEVLRGISDSAAADAKKSAGTEYGKFAETHHIIVNSMRELVLEQRKPILAMRKQQLELLAGRTH